VSRISSNAIITIDPIDWSDSPISAVIRPIKYHGKYTAGQR